RTAETVNTVLELAARAHGSFIQAGPRKALKAGEFAQRSASDRSTRQGLGKYTRIRRRDYPKLTRFVKRIPPCLGHVCCIDLGEDSETNRGFFRRQATNTKVMGTS